MSDKPSDQAKEQKERERKEKEKEAAQKAYLEAQSRHNDEAIRERRNHQSKDTNKFPKPDKFFYF